MLLILIDGAKYQEWTPTNEDELEQMVIEHAQEIFGENSIYLDRKLTLRAISGIGSIPDGYVIVFGESPEWHIVEVELSSHQLYEHIVPQVSKFVAGIANPATKSQIVSAIYNQVNGDDLLKIKAKKALGSEEIYKFLAELVTKLPIVTIVIEKKTSELDDALNAINHPMKKVIEFQTFRRVGVEAVHAHIFEPAFQRGEIIIQEPDKPVDIVKRRGLKLYIKNGKHYNPIEGLEVLGATLEKMVEGRSELRAIMPDGAILKWVGSTKNGKSKIAKVHAYLLDHGFTFQS